MTLVEQSANLLSKLNLSPEERLLLLCARLKLNDSQRDELVELVQGAPRWDQVLYKAHWHQLSPLMYHHLRDIDAAPGVPDWIMEQLEAAYKLNAIRNLHFHGELQTVLNALEAGNVPVILLKGAALSGSVYKDMGLRPMADLDLLVREEQGDSAQNILQGLGFTPVGSTDQNHQHLPGMTRKGSLVLIEVHRHIERRDSGLHFDISGFWSRTEQANIAKKDVSVLSPEDLLIHLTLNFYRDRRFRSAAALRQLCDVAEVLKFYRDRMRWQLFLDNVNEYQLNGPVGCVLYLARELLDAPVDPRVAQELWPENFDQTQIERFLRRRVIDTREWVARSLVPAEQEYSASMILRSAFRRLIPSRRYLTQSYNSASQRVPVGFLYLMRLAQGLRILARAVRRPGAMLEDLAVDRWHHSLYRNRRG